MWYQRILFKYRKAAINALKKELRCKGSIENKSNPSKKDIYYINAVYNARREAFKNLLTMYGVAKGLDIFNNEHLSIPDEDRVVVYQAICCRIPLIYIQLLLDNYPQACESGGCVDHIRHPIHAACMYYREAIASILDVDANSSNQPNKKGQMPFEIFLENKNVIDDISSEEFLSIANRFTSLNPATSKAIFSRRRESLKQKIFCERIIPSHVKYQGSHSSYSSRTSSCKDISLDNL